MGDVLVVAAKELIPRVARDCAESRIDVEEASRLLGIHADEGDADGHVLKCLGKTVRGLVQLHVSEPEDGAVTGLDHKRTRPPSARAMRARSISDFVPEPVRARLSAVA